MTSLIYNTGTLSAFIIGSVMSYNTIPYLMISFPIVYLVVVFFFIQETPQFLIKQKKYEVGRLGMFVFHFPLLLSYNLLLPSPLLLLPKLMDIPE